MEKRKNKRGLSEIITTLIIIMMSLVAIFIIWVVIRNVIEKGSEEISFDKFSVDLNIEKVLVNPGTLDVTVKRNPGQGTIKALKFIVYDGSSSQTLNVNDPGLDELVTKTFTLSYDGLAKEVSVAPVFDSNNLGNPITKKYSDVDALKNIGLISWWRFEGNPNDAIGGNTGSPVSAGVSYQSGKFGQAVNLSLSSYINISDSPSGSLDPANGITVVAWENSGVRSGYNPILAKTTTSSGLVTDGYELIYFNNDLHFRTASGDVGYDIGTLNSWNHIAGTYSSSSGRVVLYVNGVLRNNVSASGAIPDSTHDFWIGSALRGSGFFKGKIDEVMIFDRALSPGQIMGLKNYTFS